MGIVSRIEVQQGMAATHILESKEQVLLAELKESKAHLLFTSCRVKDYQVLNTSRHGSYSPTGEPRIGTISRLEIKPGMTATHTLKNQEQLSSAGLKHIKALQPPTSCRAKDRHH